MEAAATTVALETTDSSILPNKRVAISSFRIVGEFSRSIRKRRSRVCGSFLARFGPGWGQGQG